MSMIEKSYKNDGLGIQLKSFIDSRQNVWFLGKDVAKIYTAVCKAFSL